MINYHTESEKVVNIDYCIFLLIASPEKVLYASKFAASPSFMLPIAYIILAPISKLSSSFRRQIFTRQ